MTILKLATSENVFKEYSELDYVRLFPVLNWVTSNTRHVALDSGRAHFVCAVVHKCFSPLSRVR